MACCTQLCISQSGMCKVGGGQPSPPFGDWEVFHQVPSSENSENETLPPPHFSEALHGPINTYDYPKPQFVHIFYFIFALLKMP